MEILNIILEYREALLRGLFVTMKLVAFVWSIGLFCGILLGTLSIKWKYFVGIPVKVLSFILGGIPILVFLYWMHYPFQKMLNIVIDPFWTAIIVLSVINTFAVSDATRKILKEFPSQYLIAAKVCGLSSFETFFHIELPLIARQLIPILLVIQVTMLQSTLFASLISVEELFRVAQRINADIYKPVETYSSLALFFLAICLPLNGLAMWMQARFTRNISER